MRITSAKMLLSLSTGQRKRRWILVTH